jgi:chemotaxis protein MotB
VDALSTLLMVIIFVLLVFVLAQGFLSTALQSRDRALDRLNAQVAELSELLALERGQTVELRQLLTRTAAELRGAVVTRDSLSEQLRALQVERETLTGDTAGLRGERDRLAARVAELEVARSAELERLTRAEARLADALGRAESATGDTARTIQRLNEQVRTASTERVANERALTEATRNLVAERTARAETEQRFRETAGVLETARQELATLRRQAAETTARIAEMEQRIAALRGLAEELNRTVSADRATIEARLADIARMQQEIARLNALREQAERATQAAERRIADAEGSTAEQQRLSESARAQVALLTRQLEELRGEINRLANALDASEAKDRENEAQVVNLRTQLNAALASRVEELQRYRSEFFGRLREVLGDRPELRIVGDRFIFQSEVLFPPGSAELSLAGQQQIRELSRVLLDIASRIPPDLPWLLRVDGHADRNPIRSSRYATNWELSAARAIAVANLLMEVGLPANRVAAAAFGEFQPIDPGDTPEAFARNRRIELRLTDR